MRPIVLTLAVAGILAAGCQQPVLTVNHRLPAAIPLGGPLRVEGASATGDAPAGLDAHFAGALAEALAELEMVANDGAGFVTRPRIAVDVDDTRATRTIRREVGGAAAGEEAPSLARRVTMEVEFDVWPATAPRGGEPPRLTVALRRHYNSQADARIRGPLGLLRPDDPERMLSVDAICRELTVPLVEEFASLLEPLEAPATIALRKPTTAEGRQGLRYAANGQWDDALTHLTRAAAAAPDSAAERFNLAATAEAAGRLETALEHYTAARELTGQADTEAVEAARRVRQTIEHRKAAERFEAKFAQ